jgi:hypothetical protein
MVANMCRFPHKKVVIFGHWLLVRHSLDSIKTLKYGLLARQHLHNAQFNFYFLKYSPYVLTMSFSHAKVKALREASRLREEAASPETSLSVGMEVPGGEVVGGSKGGLDFLMPGGGVASVVDSVEEMFADEERVSPN